MRTSKKPPRSAMKPSRIGLLLALGVAAAMLALPTAARASYPGANGRITFASRVVGGTYDIFVMNPDQTGLLKVTSDTANDRDPAISPDGTKIAFRTDRDGNDEIYVMNADGTDPTRLTTDAAQDYGPAWSPDGTSIVWVRQALGPPFVHVMNADGTNDRALARGGGTPHFSPDGQKIAFERLLNPPADLRRAVYIVNADGTHIQQVTPSSLNAGMPAWSPDGNRLVVASEICETCQESDLYTIKSNGKDLRRLTFYLGTGVNAHEPVWAPNGRQILFTHWDDLTTPMADLFLVDVDGGGTVNFTNTTGVLEREADWETLVDR
jgi:Tol biopolymer transport system component